MPESWARLHLQSTTRSRADCGSVRGGVAAQPEPAAGVPGGDRGQRRAEGGFQGLPRAGADRSQPRLELRPGRLDRVHVGRVGREIRYYGADSVAVGESPARSRVPRTFSALWAVRL